MNRFFRRIIATIISFGCIMGLVMMLRFGSPVFKVFLVAGIVGVIWLYVSYLKTDRKKIKTKKSKS